MSEDYWNKQLLPCPSCGGESVNLDFHGMDQYLSRSAEQIGFVECKDCRFEITIKFIEESEILTEELSGWSNALIQCWNNGVPRN